MWNDLNARRTVRKRGWGEPTRWLVLAAGFAAIMLGMAWGRDSSWFGARAAGPLLAADGRALPVRIQPDAGHAALDLSDGSRVTVAERARLDVLETSGRTVALALRSGRARFDVRPRGPRTWRIDCGSLTVEVVGTAFVIERTLSALHIEVLRGAVLVRGESVPDGVQRLNGGQSLRLGNAPENARSRAASRPPSGAAAPSSGESAALQLEAPSASAPVAPIAGESMAVEPDARSVARAASESVELAARTSAAPPAVKPTAASRARASAAPAMRSAAPPFTGSAAPALASQVRGPLDGALVRPAGGDPTPVELEVEALLRQSDAMRLAGWPEAAVALLTRVVEAQPRDVRAALAAFALARLHLGVLAEPARAIRDLQQALALGLPAALREDAYAKLAEAHERAGDRRAACTARGVYARRFPRGTKLAEMQQRCQVDQAP
jgi:transmembrane sensor